MLTVAVYGTSRVWDCDGYSDCRRLLYVRRVRSAGKARKLRQELSRYFAKPRYDRFSVLGGEDYTIVVRPSGARLLSTGIVAGW